MKERYLQLKEYGISNDRYQELRCFCLQYPTWVKELKHTQDALKSPVLSFVPKGGEQVNQTEALVIKRERLRKKCEIVEQTAIEVNPELYQYIIKNVTDRRYSVQTLKAKHRMPIGERQFYILRRKFFVELDRKKQ